jgi:hypothetical protein
VKSEQVGKQTRWIVRRSNYPFAIPGGVLGVVEASDQLRAFAKAEAEYSGPFTVEPEHRVNPALEKVIARAVKGAERRARHGRYAQPRPRRKPLTHPDGDGA